MVRIRRPDPDPAARPRINLHQNPVLRQFRDDGGRRPTFAMVSALNLMLLLLPGCLLFGVGVGYLVRHFGGSIEEWVLSGLGSSILAIVVVDRWAGTRLRRSRAQQKDAARRQGPPEDTRNRDTEDRGASAEAPDTPPPRS